MSIHRQMAKKNCENAKRQAKRNAEEMPKYSLKERLRICQKTDKWLRNPRRQAKIKTEYMPKDRLKERLR
jgi:hypothetical protein